jgi:hypothetical protein
MQEYRQLRRDLGPRDQDAACRSAPHACQCRREDTAALSREIARDRGLRRARTLLREEHLGREGLPLVRSVPGRQPREGGRDVPCPHAHRGPYGCGYVRAHRSRRTSVSHLRPEVDGLHPGPAHRQRREATGRQRARGKSRFSARVEEAGSANEHAVLKVADNGCGISEADPPRIFERGFTGENGRSARASSTGMGLYLVRTLCEKMGLSVSVRSRPKERVRPSRLSSRRERSASSRKLLEPSLHKL